jgi:anti-anti-sigma factor
MATPKSTMKIQATDGALRLYPNGDLVASTVRILRKDILKAVEEAQASVVLVLSATKQIDSLGITLVLGLFKSCQNKKLGFSVEGVNPDLMRVFKLFNLNKFFPIAEAPRE